MTCISNNRNRPGESFNIYNSNKVFRRASIKYDERFNKLSYKKITKRVLPERGVIINYIYCLTMDFSKPTLIGKRISIKYDPRNINDAYAVIDGSWKRLSVIF